MTTPLTEPQTRMLRILRSLNDRCTCGTVSAEHGRSCTKATGVPRSVAPAQVARASWPDSVGWTRRTRKFGTNDPGAVGGTMPMKAATVLHRLADRGCVMRVGATYDPLASLWVITELGRRVLDGTDEPREKR